MSTSANGLEKENDDTVSPLLQQANANSGITNANDLSDRQIELCNEHKKIVEETKSKMNFVVFLTIFLVIIWYMRYNIFVLYARTFYDNNTMISIIVYISEIYLACLSLFVGILSDRWRYDNLIVIVLLIDTICNVFQAIAWNFNILSIAFILGSPPFNTLAKAYVGTMLPNNDAKLVVGTLFFWTIIAGLLVQ